jgi:Sulfotransferase family
MAMASMRKRPRDGAPIFVCGVARSGTTWVGRSLGQSPELTYIDEAWLVEKLSGLADWFGMLHDEWGGWTPWNRRSIDRGVFVESLARWYRELLDEAADGKRFVEKTPDWNALQLRFLHEMFPGAHYVLIYRDGRNSVASLEAKLTRDGERFDFAESCSRWAAAMDVFRDIRRTGDVEHVAFVRYEDLLSDFDAVFERLCDSVGVPAFDPGPFKPNTSFPEANDGGDFNERWRSWSAERQETFERLAGHQLAEWGYA